MIVIADPSPSLRATVAERLGLPVSVHQVAALGEVEQLGAEAGHHATVVLLGPGLDRADALQFAEKVDRERLGIATLLLAESLDPTVMREALRSGVDDVLTVDAPEDEWREAIGRAQARVAAEHGIARTPSGAAGQPGRVVTVFSTKGGCGKSLVASNLAVLAAAELGQRVGLVDLDLQSGDLAIMFQLMPALSIFDAAEAADRLDGEAMQGYLTAHRSGVSLLAAPMEPSLADKVPADAVGRILAHLRELYPLTVVDGPALFTDQVLAALDVSDVIVLVGSMDVPSIKNLRLAINTFQQLGHGRERLRIVLNRADSKVGLRLAEVEKSLDTRIDVAIPSSRDVPLSVNQGTPLAASRPRSQVVQAVAKLLPAVLPADADQTAPRRRRR